MCTVSALERQFATCVGGRRNQKGGSPKGWFWRMFPRNENRNEGTFGCSPGTQNRNEGTFGCSPGTKTGTRVHSPKPPFYETALLSPGEVVLMNVALGPPDVAGLRQSSHEGARMLEVPSGTSLKILFNPP